MSLVAFNKSDQNDAALDPWSVVHFGAGLAVGLVNINWPIAVVGAVGYEFVEQYAERHPEVKHFFGTSGPESAVNAAIDVGLFMIGWHLGRRYNNT